MMASGGAKGFLGIVLGAPNVGSVDGLIFARRREKLNPREVTFEYVMQFVASFLP